MASDDLTLGATTVPQDPEQPVASSILAAASATTGGVAPPTAAATIPDAPSASSTVTGDAAASLLTLASSAGAAPATAAAANPQGPPITPPDPAAAPPGLELVALSQLSVLNTPRVDAVSQVLQHGTSVTVEAPSEGITGRPVQLAPPLGGAFVPGNAGGSGITPDTSRTALTTDATTLTLAATVTNPIVLENQKPGNPESEWDLSGPGSTNIEGFATDISVNHGTTVSFKINTNSTNYRVDIYRLGYYGGMGARKVATLQHQAPATIQPGALRDPATGEVDAGNWSVTDSWAVPADAVSGVYIAKLVRQDGTFGENQIPFIVRDDSSHSDIVFQTSDETWQAYNGWGGASLYGGNGPGGGTAPGRAYAVSYNRPIATRDGVGTFAGPQDYLFGAEYSALRWMEQNGYDVSYLAGIDVSRNGALLQNHKIYTSTGHDEYWTGDQRTAVEAAKHAGVNLAFMSGNELYWKTRLAPSLDASATPNRTLISYKETREGPIDPSNEWTGTWRDPTFSPPADGGRFENATTGTEFQVDSYRADSITIPYGETLLRFWRDTSVANTAPGQSASLVQNILGYEWDEAPDNGARPPGSINLSSTTLPVSTYLLDYGNTTGSENATHHLTLYRDPSGALVFGAGTVFWAWGLDSHHDLTPTATDPSVQQAMVNLFADMGVQPQTLQTSLKLASQSTDHTAPVSTITSPTSGAGVGEGQSLTISGTASDTGGLVALVEVSTDGGTTWHPAGGTASNWTYSWVTPAPGTYTVKSRAVDDSLNLETPAAGIAVTVNLASAVSLFRSTDVPDVLSDSDSNSVELGVKFTSSQSGTISGIRFYKGAQNTGAHTGSLWSSNGTLLATASFSGETASGWQQVNFSTPVAITAGTTYVASYHTSNGHYSWTPNYFVQPHTSGGLTAPTSGAPNPPTGVFAYAGGTTFPTGGLESAINYWVDVVFNPGGQVVNQPPVANADSGFNTTQNTALNIPASALLANDTDPNGDTLSITGVSGASNGTVAYNTTNQTVTFTPTTGYTGPASFSYSITDGHGGTASAGVTLSVTTTPTSVSLFNSSDTPSVLSDSDTGAVELGVKFTASQDGTISAIRYYKSAQNTGTHTAHLWSATGASLGTATFSGETTSGWQQVNFSAPISVTAGTTYIASYHTDVGHYSATEGYFSTAHTSGPLTAPSDAASGGNGVYTYGSGSTLPTSSFNATNYWVDVVFNPGGQVVNQPPVANADSGFNTTQNTALNIPASALLANDTDPNGDTLSVTGVSGASNGTVAYNSTNQTVTFTPTTGYTGPASFSYSITDGHGGTASANVALSVTAPAANQPPVANADSGFTTTQNTALNIPASALLANDTDPNGDALSVTGVSGASNGAVAYNSTNQTVTFTPTTGYTGPASFSYSITDGKGGTASANVALSVTAPATNVSLFAPTDAPAVLADSDRRAVELGVKFTASQNGTITGIRYYKSTQNTGTHTAHLWSATGTSLGTATFSGETTSGWQQVNFSTPISVTAGSTYVASYHTNSGRYSTTEGYFNTAHSSGPLTAPSSASSGGNGVYAYGTNSAFPTNSFNATNYWVDVVFQGQVAA